MNKFLWNLFGIKEDDIPDPTRRGFLKLLGGAAVTGVVAPKYFLAPAGGWPVTPVKWVPYHQPVTISLSDLIVPSLNDSMFKMSPMFMHLSEVGTYPRKLHKGRRGLVYG